MGANNRRKNTPTGSIKLVARHSGKVLEVAGVGTADGSNVQQWSYWGRLAAVDDHQRWGGYYRLTPTHAPSKCLDVNGCPRPMARMSRFGAAGAGPTSSGRSRIPEPTGE